jgi:Arc/MetJ-type ribon-helix-helix transcriptional regulator
MRRSRTIILKPEQRIIQAELDSGHFRSPDEVLDHALAALREKEHKSKAAAPRKNVEESIEDFLATLHEWRGHSRTTRGRRAPPAPPAPDSH